METYRQIAETCLEAAESNALTFPEMVGRLTAGGFESYAIDFRRATAIYYRPDGDSVELPTHRSAAVIAAELDIEAMRAAIGEAQRLAPGYTYVGFCSKAMKAGCVGYAVSFPGRRAVYFGRNADMHVEHFPQ